jgi:enoyl-CoA hydratase/carnithine racemase
MLISERRGAVLVLTLNNPAKYNALSAEVLADLAGALAEAGSAPGVRAIILTGAGKGFCSGAQFGGDTFGRGAGIAAMMRKGINPLIAAMRSMSVPIVVAVNGAAAGAGVGLALAGDIVIAARSARFILSFVRLGAVLDSGTSVFLQRSIGSARAAALSLLGEPLTAETAAEWGLIWKVVDDAGLLDEALAVAQRLAEGPPVAIELIKRQVDSCWRASLQEALDDEADAQSRAFATEDLREGAAAFVEKRPPRFVGR